MEKVCSSKREYVIQKRHVISHKLLFDEDTGALEAGLILQRSIGLLPHLIDIRLIAQLIWHVQSPTHHQISYGPQLLIDSTDS